MENALIYTALAFGALASLLSLFLFVSRSRLQETLSSLRNKLTLEQSRIAEFNSRTPVPKPKPESKTNSENNKHSAELLELRKSSAHLKDEIKQLKQSLRNAEQHIKDYDGRSEGNLFKLRAENAALLERMKDIEQNSQDKKRAAYLEQELSELRIRFKEANQESNAAGAKLKSERQTAERQKQQLESLQSEVRQLKARLPESDSPKSPALPAIDPKQLERWKDRAFTARYMYKMMRQMRELSDLKLSTYQEAVIEVSATFLALKGVSAPELAPNENKADRLLAEAWALVHPDTASTAPTHPIDVSANA